MQSIIASSTSKLLAGAPLRLFRSHRSDFADGGQLRDFIYVKDCVDIVVWLLQNPTVSGLFNVGTGRARSWLDLAHAMFAAINQSPKIEYIEMPAQLTDKYQYFTEAKMNRLQAAGYTQAFTELEAGVCEYIGDFLSREDPYR
jgi:ADP-L-glycero-D-manno-heptose 6-epimerase